jgi:hypothetical protein
MGRDEPPLTARVQTSGETRGDSAHRTGPRTNQWGMKALAMATSLLWGRVHPHFIPPHPGRIASRAATRRWPGMRRFPEDASATKSR